MELDLGLPSLLGGNIPKDMQVNLYQEWGLPSGGLSLLDNGSLVDEVLSAALGSYQESASSSCDEAAAIAVDGCVYDSSWNNTAASFCGADNDGIFAINELFESSSVKSTVFATEPTYRSRACHDSGISSCDTEFWPQQPVTFNSNDLQISSSVPSRFTCAPEEAAANSICEPCSPSEGSQSTIDEEDGVLAFLGRILSVEHCELGYFGQYDQYEGASEEYSADADDIATGSEGGFSGSYTGSSRGATIDNTIQTPTTGRKRGRKRCVSDETRRERKRQQNREAAQRYRNRKHGETDALGDQLEDMESRNRALRDELRHAETELKILKSFVDRFDLRGLLRRRVEQNKSSLISSLNDNASIMEKLANYGKASNAMGANSRPVHNKIITVVRPASNSADFTINGSKRNQRELFESQPPCKVLRR